MLCALLLLGATSATSSLACRSTTDSSTTVQCAELPNADGEGCNYFTCMGWDCTSCANCAGGWIADPTQCGAAADTAAPPDESGCTESRCSSPDGQGGYDCYAPASRGEECSCTQGSARVLSVFDWEDTQLYHYSCCDSGPTDGPSCGYTSPPSPLVPLLIVAGVLYIVSMTFVYCWYAKAKARAQGVPTSGYCSTPPNAVDVSADSLDVSAGFRAMGRREVMPQALEPHMSRDEYADRFVDPIAPHPPTLWNPFALTPRSSRWVWQVRVALPIAHASTARGAELPCVAPAAVGADDRLLGGRRILHHVVGDMARAVGVDCHRGRGGGARVRQGGHPLCLHPNGRSPP